jgi:phenylalanyl-tRNA synthetase beta chain
MRASVEWLKELSGIDASADEIAARFTAAGLEVEAIEEKGAGLDRVVIAEVRSKRAHPKRANLTLVTVFDGAREIEVVCGAPNVPEPGANVLFAQVGAKLPNGLEIAPREIAGVASHGMLASEVELGIGPESDGIAIVHGQTPGAAITDALGLRDTILEIGLTPNRPDCLGHVGLARELAMLFGERLSIDRVKAPARISDPRSAKPAFAKSSPFDLAKLYDGRSDEVALDVPACDVTIADPVRCPRYGAALVLGVAIAPSPLRIRYRLENLGVRAINNVVDATNLVMLEWGHPIHGFDLARVRGRRIDVRAARDGETMATLDGVERKLTHDDLLICAGDGPVAVAGVMGGQNSEIAESTRDVLIECAYFDPRSVRRTSRRLGLHTDASHRFERGVDPPAVPLVLARAASLLAELAGGTVVRTGGDVYPAPIAKKHVVYRHEKATELLGFSTSANEAQAILERLGCAVNDRRQALDVEVPTHRPDLGREVDLIEEIARVRGYDHIPIEVPHVRPSAEGSPKRVHLDRILREAAVSAGLVEAVTYSFVATEDLVRSRVRSDAVPLLNPLSEERSVLRTSLLPGLAAAARHSLRRQVDRVRLFEAGQVFAPSTGDLPVETGVFAALLVGPRQAWIGDAEAYDFYDGKAVLEHVGALVIGASFDYRRADDTPAWLHPRRSAAVSLAGRALGFAGELHPDVADAWELGRAVYAELDLAELETASASLGRGQAVEPPRFPAVARDIALVVDEAVAAEEVAHAIRRAGGALVERVELFDLYRGEHVPAGRKSLAFRVTYRDRHETLTDARVDTAHLTVRNIMVSELGASLR